MSYDLQILSHPQLRYNSFPKGTFNFSQDCGSKPSVLGSEKSRGIAKGNLKNLFIR
jgi:hypothetical protein